MISSSALNVLRSTEPFCCCRQAFAAVFAFFDFSSPTPIGSRFGFPVEDVSILNAYGSHHRAQSSLVIVQMALTLVLLVSAGLLFRMVRRLWDANPGFDTQQVITFKVGFRLADEASL